ncbi:hypothetical protein F53441_13985 [Fusarium austroafricanum]|uniref:Uncharacterized protein n=1 Tax=Fusarium austroafricanum TaxID=2364996 RepID=A0A8H4JMC0_9HYPO|nr:hypothetical protein F53441_13985 [Fusarium austroafricanum]
MTAVEAVFDREFNFLKFQVNSDQCQDSITVECIAHWCYCGPLLKPDLSLSHNFYEFENEVFTGSIRYKLIPFLNYIKNHLIAKDFEHYLLNIRGTTDSQV